MKKRIGIFLLIVLITGIGPVKLVGSATLPKGVSLEITSVTVAGGRDEVAVGEVFDIFADAKYSGMPDHTQVDMVLFYVIPPGPGTAAQAQIIYPNIYTEYVTGSGVLGTVFSMAVEEAGVSDLIWVGLWTSLVPNIEQHNMEDVIWTQYTYVEAFDVTINLDVEYPTSNLAVGEPFPVIATVEYGNVPINYEIAFHIYDNTSPSGGLQPGLLGGDYAQPDPIGIGKTGTTSHTFTIHLDSPGPTELSVKAGWENYEAYAGGGGDPFADTVTFVVNIVSLDNPSPSAAVEIHDVDYATDEIPADEETPIIVAAYYSGLDEGSKLSVSIYDLATGSFLGSEVSELLGFDGWYTFRPVEVFPPRSGSLRVEVEAVTGARIVAEATKDISMTVVGAEAAVAVSTIEYVKSPDTIAVGESTPVTVTTEYSDLASGSTLMLWIKDLDKNDACEGSTLSSIVLSGSGTYTFPQVKIRPSTAGDWHLETVIELNGDTVATKQFTMKVISTVGAEASRVTIGKFLYPRDPITVGQTTPITVEVHFLNLPGNAILRAYINDEDTHTQVGSGTSTPLSGSGEYTFSNMLITPSRAGDWHLIVGVTDYPDAVEGFKIKVVAPAGEPGVQIKDVKQPGSVKVGEPAPITVAISYENLAPGTKLTVIIHDYDARKDLGSVTSIALSGSGTYTFPAITIKATRDGTWRLGVMISGYPETKTDFTIKVAK